jgi:hypothetical protein
LAVLDQRLMYWPFWPPGADRDERTEIVKGWQRAMIKAFDAGALLAGYIDESRRNSVVALLSLLRRPLPTAGELVENRDKWPGLTDTDLYKRLLEPGQRSVLYLDVSEDNASYARVMQEIEVCFFYLNVARPGSSEPLIARIDIPRWVADEPAAVDEVHALLYDQCQILGGYPYVLFRAHEMAVVGRQDQAEFDHWIALSMQQMGMAQSGTSKQQVKDIGVGARTRFE